MAHMQSSSQLTDAHEGPHLAFRDRRLTCQTASAWVRVTDILHVCRCFSDRRHLSLDGAQQVPSTPGRLRRARCLRSMQVSKAVSQLPRVARGFAIAHHPRCREKDVQASVCFAVLLRWCSLLLLPLLGTTAKAIWQRRWCPHVAHLNVRLSNAPQCERASATANQKKRTECVGYAVEHALRPAERA